MRILYSRFFAESGFPSSFLKFASAPPSTAPSDRGRLSSYLCAQRRFACSHTTLFSVDVHSIIMCSKVSGLLHRGQVALSSHPGMWFQKFPSLYILCTCFHRKSRIFLVTSLLHRLFHIASSVGVSPKMSFVAKFMLFRFHSVAILLIPPSFVRWR